MAITFDKAFGIHQHTIGLRSRRAEILSDNLANADTPHFKARDLDFQTALENSKADRRFQLTRTNSRHFKAEIEMPGEVKFRVPTQPDTGDGNTVDSQYERTAFMENTLEYRTSLTFLNSKISGLKRALKGQGQ